MKSGGGYDSDGGHGGGPGVDNKVRYADLGGLPFILPSTHFLICASV